MNGRRLLDTNIIIALFAGEDLVLRRLARQREVFVSSIVVGELYYGAFKSHHRKENLQRIDEFVSHNTVLDCNAETARFYGQAKDNLRAIGRPIPENDLWIAATALQHDLKLVSRDAHFELIRGLKHEIW